MMDMRRKRLWGRILPAALALSLAAIPAAYADEFLLTAAAQRNRNHAGPFVRFEGTPFAMEEVLFDPQTSGGLLAAVPEADALKLREDLRQRGLPAEIVGEITEKTGVEILVRG